MVGTKKNNTKEHGDVGHNVDEHKDEATYAKMVPCMPSSKAEEAVIKKKYGGIVPKKPPLISKDHERAFFDSADWALGKQEATLGQKTKCPVETLQPKLQPTPHQPLPPRRSSYAP